MLSASASPAHSSIFDRDDRQYVSPAAGSPYSPVGLVRQGSTFSVWLSFATGFLVDDCHVLTSQTVLGTGQAPLGKRLKFQTGIGTPQEQSTKGTVVAAGGIKRHKTMEERYQDAPRTWLLLRLDKCLGATVGHVTLKTGPFSPYEFNNLQSAGYPVHRDRDQGLTIDPSCRIIAGRGPVWLNDCATVKADAGDPIFRISTSGGKPHMEVYAMQAYAFIHGQPIALTPGSENQAIPMSQVARQIETYLSPEARQEAGPADASQSQPVDALSYVGTSSGVHSDGPVLATRLAAAQQKSHSEGGAQ